MSLFCQMHSISRYALYTIHSRHSIKPLLHRNTGNSGRRKFTLYLHSPGAKQLTKRVQSGAPGREFFRDGKEEWLDHNDPAAAGSDESPQQRIKCIECIRKHGNGNFFVITVCHNISDIIDPTKQKHSIEALPRPHPLPFAIDAGECETVHASVDKRNLVAIAK